MAQCIFKDSGMLFQDCPDKTVPEIESAPWFNSAIEQAVNVPDQVWDWASGAIYFYVESLDYFFKRENGLHPFLVAARGLFSSARWSAIELLIDQYRLNEALDAFDLDRYSNRLDSLQTLNLITEEEEDLLLSVLPPQS